VEERRVEPLHLLNDPASWLRLKGRNLNRMRERFFEAVSPLVAVLSKRSGRFPLRRIFHKALLIPPEKT